MELDYIFSVELHKKLKEKIRGRVFCKVENDVLHIRIDMDDLWFETEYDDLAKRVCFGLTTDYIAYEVCQKYEKFLINRTKKYYFKG